MTLVELVLAAIVFVVASTGIVAAAFQCQRLLEHAHQTMQAANDGQDLLERIRATPFDQLQADFPNGVANGGGANDYAAIVGGYSLEGQQIVVTYPSQAAGRVEILVTVNWTHRSRASSTRFSTVRTTG